MKNTSFGTADIIFINKLQFLIFSFFWFTKLIQVHGSMFPCYSSLNMKVIWRYMVSAPPPITMEWLNLNMCQIFVVNFFLDSSQDKPLWMEFKIWGSNIYYYITTLSLFHFFGNSQHLEKWGVSFKNFFRKF